MNECMWMGIYIPAEFPPPFEIREVNWVCELCTDVGDGVALCVGGG